MSINLLTKILIRGKIPSQYAIARRAKMKKQYKKLSILLFSLLLFACASVVNAHQPRLVMDKNSTKEKPIIVEAPEISKAYYGRLKGKPDYYKINSSKTFRLYLGLLLPNISGDEMNFVSAEVWDSTGKELLLLDGTQQQWNPYYEKFGGDWYLEGPEAKINLPAGTYFIEVYNSTNRGKYSLAIGDIESFPPLEIIKTIALLPVIKERFFNKSIFIPFLFFIGFILTIGTIIISCISVFRYRKSINLAQKINEIYKLIKLPMWLGFILTCIIWFFWYVKNPFNIFGALNTLILVLLIILFLYMNIKLTKYGDKKKMPSKSILLSSIGWLIFLFITLVVI
jgi:hypothetical protein